MTRQTNALTEGAFMAVIAAILGLAGIYLPLLGAVTGFLWPIPIIVLIIRYDLRSGFLSLIAALILMVTLSEPLTALFRVAIRRMALVFGYSIKQSALKHYGSAGRPRLRQGPSGLFSFLIGGSWPA